MNQVSIKINAPDTVHNVYLVQDTFTKTTIHATLDANSPKDITGCTASSDGTQFKGIAHIFWFHDPLNLMDSGNQVTLAVENVGNYSGILSSADSAALVAFVKACGLPDLGT